MLSSFFLIEVLGNSSIALFIFNCFIPLVAIGVLTNTSFTSGSATKVLALLMLVVGIMWLVFGGGLARRLSNGYTSFVPSGALFKRYAQNPEKNKVSGGLALGSAIFLDRTAATAMINVLPFPLNYFYWMGMWPIVPFCLFGLLPSVFSWSSLGALMGLAAVMDAGGDGTEYVEAKKIHWFYSLSPADRERVREGSDLEDGDDSSDSSDSDDEETGIVKKSKAKATAAAPQSAKA